MVSLSRRKILNQGPWRRFVTQQLIYSHWLKLKLKSAIRNCHRIVAILWLCGSTSKLNEDTTKRKLHKNSFLFSVFQFFFFTPFSNSHFFSFFESFTCCIVNFVFLIILNNFFRAIFPWFLRHRENMCDRRCFHSWTLERLNDFSIKYAEWRWRSENFF